MYSYSLFIMDNFLLTALNDTWMGVRLTFRPEHLVQVSLPSTSLF